MSSGESEGGSGHSNERLTALSGSWELNKAGPT
ncbi:MAG: hypothetical protein JWN95_1507 [Frankiales bacterium]|nr:hypothetical protein [Frankiales bacterium]